MTIVFEVRVFTLHGGDPSVVEAFSNQSRVFRGFIAVMFVMTVLISDLLFVSIMIIVHIHSAVDQLTYILRFGDAG